MPLEGYETEALHDLRNALLRFDQSLTLLLAKPVGPVRARSGGHGPETWWDGLRSSLEMWIAEELEVLQCQTKYHICHALQEVLMTTDFSHKPSAKVRKRSRPTLSSAMPSSFSASSRVAATLSTAAAIGLTPGTKTKRLSGRAHEELFAAARARSGLDGSDLLEYALAKVALEDDFAERLLAREGSIDRDMDLDV